MQSHSDFSHHQIVIEGGPTPKSQCGGSGTPFEKVLRVCLGHLTMQNRVPVLKRPSGAVSGHSVSMTPQSLFVPPPMPPMVRSLITRRLRHSNALIFVLTHSQPKLNQPNPIIKPSRPSSFIPMSLFPSVFSPRAHPHGSHALPGQLWTRAA